MHASRRTRPSKRNDGIKTNKHADGRFLFSGNHCACSVTSAIPDASAGRFDVKWGYENIDENGNTLFDEETWLKNRRERIARLAAQ